MKSFAFATLLSIASAFTLVTVSDNDSINNKGISSIHEGAGINYFFIGTTEQGEDDLTYANGEISSSLGTLPVTLSAGNPFLTLGVIGPSPADISSGFLNLNGTEQFYGCQNVNDPYSYSKTQYAVTTSKVNDACIPLKLKVVDGDVSSSVAPSSTPVPPPFANTTTTDITVTDYTTYCPEHTTITVTTCSDHKCNADTITVTEATTLTINSCLVSSTTEPPTQPTTVSSSAPPAQSTVAEISTFDNGANKVAGGLAGLAVMGALLL